MHGISLPMILLIYGLRFGLMGLLSPITVSFANKIGIVGCTLIANILRLLQSVLTISYSVDYHFSYLILLTVVMSLPGAITNPIGDSLSHKYVNQQHRSKYNSILSVAKILGAGFASAFIAWGVTAGNTVLLYLVIAVSFLLEIIFILPLSYKPDKKQSAYKSAFKFILHEKSAYAVVYALMSVTIIERLLIPLYIYIAINDFKFFSLILIFSLTVQIVPVIFFGILADINQRKTITVVSIMKSVSSLVFIFFQNKFALSLNKTFNDNIDKVYRSVTDTYLQTLMLKHQNVDKTLLATVGQMTLCFAEVVWLCLFALISMFVGEIIFYIIFATAIGVNIIINVIVAKSKISATDKPNPECSGKR